MSLRICLIDTGYGNLRSVERACNEALSTLDVSFELIRSASIAELNRASHLVFPGQGSFKDCAESVPSELRKEIISSLHGGKPYLGICLGLQVLFESSEEAPGAEGFGYFKGEVLHLPKEPELKIPHMGWNQLEAAEGAQNNPFLARSEAVDEWFYFVHSYHAVPEDRSILGAEVSYGKQRITAAVCQDHVWATQFHPEKSQGAGIALLQHFFQKA